MHKANLNAEQKKMVLSQMIKKKQAKKSRGQTEKITIDDSHTDVPRLSNYDDQSDRNNDEEKYSTKFSMLELRNNPKTKSMVNIHSSNTNSIPIFKKGKS